MIRSIVGVYYRIPVLLAFFSGPLYATQTENNQIIVQPAPLHPAIDGKGVEEGIWNLSAGLFACDNIEDYRDTAAVWVHAFYDDQYLYLVARWTDSTPMNNPGQTLADYGFNGDSFQVRFNFAYGTPQEKITHWTNWHGADGGNIMTVESGRRLVKAIQDAKTQGARQGFSVNADGKGYVQEMAIPWKLITSDAKPLHAGDRFQMTFEPNFTIAGPGHRLSIKDLFKAGTVADRIFTFQGPANWGVAVLAPSDVSKPPSVRVSGGHEFPVQMKNGIPVVDWTGLDQITGKKEQSSVADIAFTTATDGYVSIHLQNADGQIVRQLVDYVYYKQGNHRVKWDGLTTPNAGAPGDPVPSGTYTWKGILNPGLHLKFRGWADNGGNCPWDNGSTTNWGGDEGPPQATAADGDQVYLGWVCAEAGKSLLACDLNGNVKWSNNRAGISGVKAIAVEKGTVYVLGGAFDLVGTSVYKLDARKGTYLSWEGASPSADLSLQGILGDQAKPVPKADYIFAFNGKLFLSFTDANKVAMIDGVTGRKLKIFEIDSPSTFAPGGDSRILILSEGKSVLSLDPETGAVQPVISGLTNAKAIAADAQGKIYVGVGDPDNQVFIYQHGKLVFRIGRPGGRDLVGPWTRDGIRFISQMAIATNGRLWIAEEDDWPRRISVWDTASGQLWKEFFGPTNYGALGCSIDPLDPNIMVGQGCEWRLDPATGRSTCLGVILRDGMGHSHFGVGSNGRLYLGVEGAWVYPGPTLRIFERVADGKYILRSRFDHLGTAKDKNQTTRFWADHRGDGRERPEDPVVEVPDNLIFVQWYLYLAHDLTIYAGDKQFRVTGFTSAGAPLYDLAKPTKMPAPGIGSYDGTQVVQVGAYMKERSWYHCYDIQSGKLLWDYPDDYVGVHGSHLAPPAQAGMIRGSYGIAAVLKLPPPIGDLYVIPTNVGEWHLLTGDGFYLSKLFEGDPLKVIFPEKAEPGVSFDQAPPGAGGEDFGGTATVGPDGKLYIQAGKIAFWNLEITGLDQVRALDGGVVQIKPADVALAGQFREDQLQAASAGKAVVVRKLTPLFTGNPATDFNGANVVTYNRGGDASAKTAICYDDKNLYLAWEVVDATPFVNGAIDPFNLYLSGDTVDFQLGTDPAARQDRKEAVSGDLRLSIGPFQGQPTAVLYRKVSTVKEPKVFSSGVIHSYPMDFVKVLNSVKIEVSKNALGYVVEAAIPLSDLRLAPQSGLALRGDFGVTYGDTAGQRTRVRVYWSDQHTGIVDDAVYELMMEPANWGAINFE